MRSLTLPLAALLVASGCAGVTYKAPLPDVTMNCVESLRDLSTMALRYPAPESDDPDYVEFATVARCHRSPAAEAVPVALYRLEGISPPAELNVSVLLSAGGTFAAAVEVLSADFLPLRRHGFQDFVRRGNRYSLDVFLNQSEEAPAYLLLMPDSSQAGKGDTAIGSAASAMIIPAGPVMFMYTSGTETKTVRPFLTGGLILVTARPFSAAILDD